MISSKGHTEHKNPVKQTDSHASKQISTSSEKRSTSKDSVARFIEAWKNYDRAGAQFVSSMCKDLSGTQLDDVSGLLGSSLVTGLFSNSGSEQVLGHLNEMGNKLSCTQQGDKSKVDPSQVLLLFLKLQMDYHQHCTQSLISLIEQLLHTCDKKENSELFHHIRNLDLHKFTSSRHSPSRSFGFKKSSAAGSNSPKTQKHSIKTSLFSFFERKNSPDESTSSFYVDLDQELENQISQSVSDSPSSQSHSVLHSQKEEKSQSNTLIHLGLDPAVSCQESASILTVDSYRNADDALIPLPGASILDGFEMPKGQSCLSPSPASASQGYKPSLSAGATGFTPSSNGQVASQEELDSVINLLSGVGTGSGNHMSPISERHTQISLQVPSVYGSLSPAASDSATNNLRVQKSPMQRRSEGSIDLSEFGNPGRNTWPHQHRSSLPGGHLVHQVPYDYMGNSHSRRYMPENQPAMTLPPGGINHLPLGYQWGFPDQKLDRAWPVNNLARSSTWSAGQDSDDNSDDDSSSDQFYNLKQQIQPKMSVEDTTGSSKRTSQETGGRHHSFDDLLDGHSVEALQAPVHPWSQSLKGKEPGMSHDLIRNSGYHRPVTMQWSDPLSSRNMWPTTGLDSQGQIQTQSVQGFGGQ